MIVLSTLNARYIHASLGLRYLRANLGPYRDESVLAEFTTKRPPEEIVREILKLEPELVGFGVYIWNTDATLEVIRHLRKLRPELLIVAGGPEISFETEGQALFSEVDYVFQGEADFTFRDFVADWRLRGELPKSKIVPAKLPDLAALGFPYGEYTDEDIRNRTLYVEASRGCPYKCEYCLSSLDVSVRHFAVEKFLDELRGLIARGARQFKFVDRTFNLAPKISSRILEFFLEHVDQGLFLHFEMVPDRLGPELRELIRRFPEGALQFEIGIQTWSPTVARNVSRRQNYVKIVENLNFLKDETGVHTHADLIVGLPGETWESFAAGFNALFALGPDEIQVGLLKRLKGTPIVRHDEEFKMRYSEQAPFEILATRDLSAAQIADLKIFAEFWDHLNNSGRFQGLRERAGADPFAYYFSLARALFRVFGRTHAIHLRELQAEVEELVGADCTGQKPAREPNQASADATALPPRQVRHLRIQR